MAVSYRYRTALANAHFGKCVCVDKAGDCDWCSVYYAPEEELAELAELEPFLPIEKRAEVARAKQPIPCGINLTDLK